MFYLKFVDGPLQGLELIEQEFTLHNNADHEYIFDKYAYQIKTIRNQTHTQPIFTVQGGHKPINHVVTGQTTNIELGYVWKPKSINYNLQLFENPDNPGF